ncbi:hypothetical protein EMPG_14889 [Blastomyces silverae]|uniref:Uncharacterized protein n=1 Tax=Blastomyces silverae TaxID=2060906 RepID=A0A0H1BE94_9EURO|nr:hypothetical protein EMPG_14889 [Blastomyces silverae]
MMKTAEIYFKDKITLIDISVMLLSHIEIDEITLSVSDNKCQQSVSKMTIVYEKYAKKAHVNSKYISKTRSQSHNYTHLIIKSDSEILTYLNE